MSTARGTEILNRQEALRWLARQTGGLGITGNNDLSLGLSRVMADQRGYYLLGYDVSDAPAGEWNGGRVTLRVRRPGLSVRWRQGLFGGTSPTPASTADPLLLAATSPFSGGTLGLRLTALFGYSRDLGPYVHALWLLDANDVQFTHNDDGSYSGAVELVTIAVGDNGQFAGRWRKRATLNLTPRRTRRPRREVSSTVRASASRNRVASRSGPRRRMSRAATSAARRSSWTCRQSRSGASGFRESS